MLRLRRRRQLKFDCRVKSSRWRSAWAASRGSAAAAEHRDLDQLADNEVQAALADAAHWLATLMSAIFRQDDARMPVLRMLAADDAKYH